MASNKKISVQPFLADTRDDFHVSEIASNVPGAMSPFGDDVVLPLPLEKVRYTHPRPENRPHLAGSH